MVICCNCGHPKKYGIVIDHSWCCGLLNLCWIEVIGYVMTCWIAVIGYGVAGDDSGKCCCCLVDMRFLLSRIAVCC